MADPAVPIWHALLGPLPDDAAPWAAPVAPAELLATPEAAAIAGWSNLILELSAGAGGLRIVQVLLDDSGRPLSASDHVLFRSAPREGDARPWMRQENIGGRFEPDGGFRGTCWRVEGPEPEGDEAPQWAATPRAPTAAEITALEELVTELIRRQAGGKSGPPS